MSTNCKLVIGYTDHMGYWNVEKEYVRWMDGYQQAIKPLLQKHKQNIVSYLDENAEYDSHKFTEIGYNDRISAEWIYYLDVSNHAKIRCSIVALDWEFYSKYGVDSYKVIEELVL